MVKTAWVRWLPGKFCPLVWPMELLQILRSRQGRCSRRGRDRRLKSSGGYFTDMSLHQGRLLATLTVVLQSGGAKAAHPMAVYQPLPGQELFHRQGVSAACFFKADQTTPYAGDNFGFAPHDPAFRFGWRKICLRHYPRRQVSDTVHHRVFFMRCHSTVYLANPYSSVGSVRQYPSGNLKNC
jgi:hypothetical protein